MILKNALITKKIEGTDTLDISNSGIHKTFQFCVQQNEFLKHGQTIAFLKENEYTTQTGGIIHYAIDSTGRKKRRNTKKIFTGSFY